jgi:hypothetical protein
LQEWDSRPLRDLASMMGQQGVLEKEKKKSKTKDTEIIREFNRLFDDLVDECVDHHRRVF